MGHHSNRLRTTETVSPCVKRGARNVPPINCMCPVGCDPQRVRPRAVNRRGERASSVRLARAWWCV
eukprot:3807579-Prymnesium_polylepis.2